MKRRLANLLMGISAVLGSGSFALGAVQPGQTNKPADAESKSTIGLKQEKVTFTSYDLAVHLQPETSGLGALARMTIRNDARSAIQQVALELSSSLKWETVSERQQTGPPVKLRFEQHRLDTDTDHTGAENEAVVVLAHPLQPGATTELAAIYSGTVAPSAGRMERSGVPAINASQFDWDGVNAEETLLRGFGNVLWYPVVSPPIFLGDGAQLSEAMGEQRLRQSAAMVQLRLEVEYAHAAPQTAIFCGQQARLEPSGGQQNPEGEGGVLTAVFPATRLGFGFPSLFLTTAPLQIDGRAVGILTNDSGAAPAVEREATSAKAAVAEWLGSLAERQPVLFDHAGQPFAQRSLLVQSAAQAANPFAMIHLFSHAWFESEAVWLDEGVAQFLPIVAIERVQGRQAAMTLLEDQRPALILTESNAGVATEAEESLDTARREVIYRNKAVAVLWMLRGIVGDEVLKKALITLRSRPVNKRASRDFQAALEQPSGKDLAWFFRDWVFEDKGLPDLSIVSVAARANPAKGGVSEGSLVAVEVQNEGAAAAEVPVTVRSGELTATERLRVPGHGVASIRIVFQGTPQQVEVNDGSVPEARTDHHERSIELPATS